MSKISKQNTWTHSSPHWVNIRLKLTFPVNLCNSVSVAQHCLMKKPTDFQSVQPVLMFDTLLPALVFASPLPWHTRQSFPLIRIRLFHKKFFTRGRMRAFSLCFVSLLSPSCSRKAIDRGRSLFPPPQSSSLSITNDTNVTQLLPPAFCQWPYNALVVQLASIISPFFSLLQEFWGTGNGPAEEICQNPLWFHCAKCQWTLSA